jgi:serine protease Do
VRDLTELRSIIGRTAPGTKIKLLVLRDGDKKNLIVTLETLTEEALASGVPERDEMQASPNVLGLAVQDLTPDLARKLGYKDAEGVLVSRVRSGGEAERRGLQRGVLILAIDRHVIESLDDYEEALEQVKPGQAFTMRIRYGKNKRLIGMRMPDK